MMRAGAPQIYGTASPLDVSTFTAVGRSSQTREQVCTAHRLSVQIRLCDETRGAEKKDGPRCLRKSTRSSSDMFVFAEKIRKHQIRRL